MINYTYLSRNTLHYLLFNYNAYVQNINEEPERGQPVSINEYLNNDFLELLEEEGLQLRESPIGSEYTIQNI